MPKLSIVKSHYGVSQIPVIQLDYHNDGAIPTFEILKGKTDIEVTERIGWAIQHGYELEYIEMPKKTTNDTKEG